MPEEALINLVCNDEAMTIQRLMKRRILYQWKASKAAGVATSKRREIVTSSSYDWPRLIQYLLRLSSTALFLGYLLYNENLYYRRKYVKIWLICHHGYSSVVIYIWEKHQWKWESMTVSYSEKRSYFLQWRVCITIISEMTLEISVFQWSYVRIVASDWLKLYYNRLSVIWNASIIIFVAK
jgi:hypothetical protein